MGAEADSETTFSPDRLSPRLMPEHWVERIEATERPNQLFLRVGGELEMWFAEVRRSDASKQQQRRLWSRLVIAWDPDKHPLPLRSFTTQVHEALKARRERELGRVKEDGTTIDVQ